MARLRGAPGILESEMELSELEHKTVPELRELAEKYEDLEGVSGMKKEALIDALCAKLNIKKKIEVPKGIGRHDLKARILVLKKQRDEALAAHDGKALKRARTLLRRTKHRLRDVIEKATRAEKASEKKPSPAPSP
jgi:hypothetical protein